MTTLQRGQTETRVSNLQDPEDDTQVAVHSLPNRRSYLACSSIQEALQVTGLPFRVLSVDGASVCSRKLSGLEKNKLARDRRRFKSSLGKSSLPPERLADEATRREQETLK